MEILKKILALAIMICCWACSEGEESTLSEYYAIDIDKNQLNFERDGGEALITITTKESWTATIISEGKWVKVFPTNGSKGTNTITVTAQLNDDNVERKATLTISSGKSQTKIPISQTTYKKVSIQEQIETLKKFYIATNGNEWKDNTNWLSSKPLNEWHGIRTNNEGAVINIWLNDNNLTGYLPKEIEKLEYLTQLHISGNQIEGELPDELFSLINLYDLRLSSNKFTSNLSKFCQLTNLEVLELYSTQISGPIPDEINKLKKLRWIGLQGSNITGSIPESIGELPNLENMYFGYCQLEGQIPESIGNLPKLIVIGFNNNNLTGSIPGAIFKPSTLEYVALDNNRLRGSIPDEIVDAKNAWWISLHSNPNLTGIPQKTSLLDLPCWTYNWWNMIATTGITAPVEERQIPGPSFDVKDWHGNKIVAEEEYVKNKYTILIQWNPSDNFSQQLIPTLVTLYKKYADKGLGIIGWCSDAQNQIKEIEDYIKGQDITWKNFISYGDNQIHKNSSRYPMNYWLSNVHVVNSENRIVFSSIITDVNTLPGLLEELFSE